MEDLEVSAKTVEEAIELALEKLSVDRSEVRVEVLSEGRSGILGFGAENARVRVTPISKIVEDTSDAASIARNVIMELLKAMDIDAEVYDSPLPSDGVPEGVTSLAFDIRGDDLGILIGRRGQTMASLQYIVNLIVNHKLKSRTLVIVDVEGYRRRRFSSLSDMAHRLAERVRASGRSITLEPMSAAERRIIHIALHDYQDIVTQSIGEGESRKVSIAPRRR